MLRGECGGGLWGGVEGGVGEAAGWGGGGGWGGGVGVVVGGGVGGGGWGECAWRGGGGGGGEWGGGGLEWGWEATAVRKAIALLRQAIKSSPGENTGTAKPESTNGVSVIMDLGDWYIESLNDNPTPGCVLNSLSTFPIPVEDSDSFFKKSDTSLSYSDNSLPEFETFSDHTEKMSSGSTTTHADNSLPEYDSFLFETGHDQGELTSVVIEDILGDPHVPNVLPTHPTLYLDSDFAPSDDSLEPDLVVSLPSGTRNKIFDPGIFIEVQSKKFLSPNKFSISFIRDPLSLVFDTLLPFSSKNEEKVFNPGSLSSNEEKSPHLLSHRGFNPSKIIFDFSKSPMMISGGDIPILDVPFLHFYPP
ncbi:hypothetical protein Tco_0968671 [Tanacetum coccineum]